MLSHFAWVNCTTQNISSNWLNILKSNHNKRLYFVFYLRISMRSSKTSPTLSGVARPSLPLQKIRGLNQEEAGKISFTDVINLCPPKMSLSRNQMPFTILYCHLWTTPKVLSFKLILRCYSKIILFA